MNQNQPHKPHVVRFGRSDDTATKTIFMDTRKDALKLANALAFVLWADHSFKCSECQLDPVRFEHNGFWVELKHQPKAQPDFLFQGD